MVSSANIGDDSDLDKQSRSNCFKPYQDFNSTNKDMRIPVVSPLSFSTTLHFPTIETVATPDSTEPSSPATPPCPIASNEASWLRVLLSTTFHESCTRHLGLKKCELNKFCKDHLTNMCIHCLKESTKFCNGMAGSRDMKRLPFRCFSPIPSLHHPNSSNFISATATSSSSSSFSFTGPKRLGAASSPIALTSCSQQCNILHVSRYMYHPVVLTREISDFINLTSVQSYTVNGQSVIYIDRRAQQKTDAAVKSNSCKKCDRVIHAAYLFCCIYCKLAHEKSPSITEDLPLPIITRLQTTAISPRKVVVSPIQQLSKREDDEYIIENKNRDMHRMKFEETVDNESQQARKKKASRSQVYKIAHTANENIPHSVGQMSVTDTTTPALKSIGDNQKRTGWNSTRLNPVNHPSSSSSPSQRTIEPDHETVDTLDRPVKRRRKGIPIRSLLIDSRGVIMMEWITAGDVSVLSQILPFPEAKFLSGDSDISYQVQCFRRDIFQFINKFCSYWTNCFLIVTVLFNDFRKRWARHVCFWEVCSYQDGM